jgi:hypothetical protein
MHDRFVGYPPLAKTAPTLRDSQPCLGIPALGSHMTLMRSWRRTRLIGPPSSVVLSMLRFVRRTQGQYGCNQPADVRTIHYVCPRHRFILTTIPKVASKAFDYLLRTDPRFAGAVEERRGSLESVISLYPEIGEFFHFAFVRNPWDRVVSCYKDKIRSAEKMGKLALLSRYECLRPGMGFAEFVEWLRFSPEGSDRHADRHWISQHLFVADAKSDILCDFVGKLERSDDDMQHLADKLDLGSLALPMRHQSAQSGMHYRSYYTPRSLALVGERYSRDIELFGYSD